MIRTIIDTVGANSRKLIGATLALLTFLLISMPASAVQPWQTQPDAPEALGSISGTVTNEANEPLEGIEVSVSHRIYGYTQPLQTTSTDSQGRYQLDDLTTSLYILSFNDPAAQYRETFSGNGLSYGDAVEIPVAGNNVTNIDAIMPPASGIAGTLSTSVDFINGSYDVTVYFPYEDDYYDGVYWAVLDSLYIDISEATYSFDALNPGRYRICATVYGEVIEDDADNTASDVYNYLNYTECYNDTVAGIEMAEDVLVEANSVTAGIDFVLGESKDYSTISGTVTDSDGAPIPNVDVATYPDAYLDSYPAPYYYYDYARTTTDQNGEYTIETLLPYSFTLFFDAYYTNFSSEYYNDAIEAIDAEIILVEPGAHLENIDAQLSVGGSISGTLSTLSNLAGADSRVNLYRETENLYAPEEGPYYEYHRSYADVHDPETGQYVIEGLPSGSYLVEMSTNHYGAGYYNLSSYYGGLSQEEAVPVAVELGVTTANIDISVVEGQFEGAIEGRVTSDGDPIAGIRVQLVNGYYNYDPYYDPYYDYNYDVYYYDLISYAITDENGNYSLGGLTTNDYTIRFSAHSGDYVSETYFDENGYTQIYVEDGTTISGVDADLEPAAVVSGSIMRTDQQPASYYAIVVERKTEEGSQIIRSGQYTDENGYYEISGLSAGDYTLRFLPQYSNATHLRLEVSVESGDSIVGQNGVAGPNVPTSLPTIQEPGPTSPPLTDYLFLPFTMQ